MALADRVSRIAPSATLALNQKAQEMRAAGQDVVSLTAGEPDQPTPHHIIEAMISALKDGATRYTPVAGIPELRHAVAKRYNDQGIVVGADQVVASTGAKQALFNATQCLLQKGDEAVIFAPYWLSYRDMISFSGATPVIVGTRVQDNFIPQLGAIREALTPRTRVIILNSPSNPTGALYDAHFLSALAEVLREYPQVTVLWDEIYDRIVFDGAECASLLKVAPDLADRTLLINGVSKSYAMTGLRLGWAAGPRAITSAMAKLQGQSTSNSSAPVQHGAVAALLGDQSPVEAMCAAFQTRRDFVLSRLTALPNVACAKPRGAFYAFPSFEAYKGRHLPDGTEVDSALTLTAYLLHEFKLVLVPGAPFGAPWNARISYATDMATITQGLDRLQSALETLQ